MAFASDTLDLGPLGDLNTTPLIDVMLVLLVMFIITIPVATHEVEIPLPIPDPINDPNPPLNLVQNKIVIDAQDGLFWNGTPISEPQMVRLIADSLMLQPEPELQFEPSANASYERAARTLNIIKGSGVTKFGFVGNEKYRALGADAPR